MMWSAQRLAHFKKRSSIHASFLTGVKQKMSGLLMNGIIEVFVSATCSRSFNGIFGYRPDLCTRPQVRTIQKALHLGNSIDAVVGTCHRFFTRTVAPAPPLG